MPIELQRCAPDSAMWKVVARRPSIKRAVFEKLLVGSVDFLRLVDTATGRVQVTTDTRKPEKPHVGKPVQTRRMLLLAPEALEQKHPDPYADQKKRSFKKREVHHLFATDGWK